ncbi:hypothetical protein KKE92_04235 [Candidatus Micrarchaeota archaeon]|nr:hypothetical protein [Candidatus Micrarchaeota archaeon]MBU1682304.1 hypothetical protein [Candidatus Micrarchaeota archaeon]
MKKLMPVLFSISIIALIIVSTILVVLFFENNSLKADIADNQEQYDAHEQALKQEITLLKSNINQKDAELGSLRLNLTEREIEITSLSKDLAETEQKLNDTEAELKSKQTTLEEYTEEFNELSSDIEEIENSLTDSLQWLSENSKMSFQTEYFISYSSRKCVEDGELNLACIPLFMDMHIGFTYVDEPNDKLNSIDEMIEKGGGDCEDYSIFLKALLNDYEENPELIAWEAEPGSTFIVHTTSSKEWYYDDSTSVNLGELEKYHPVVFCYVTSYTIVRLEGHCIVALPEEEIATKEDIKFLEGAKTFEPQTGEYTGRIGTDFNLCYDNQSCGFYPGDSIIVISDSDLFQFIDGQWKSLGDYQGKADELKDKIETATG